MAVTDRRVTFNTARSVTGVTLEPEGWSGELREAERVGARVARTAVQGVLHDEGLGHIGALVQLQDEGMALNVVLAEAPTAETTYPHRRSPTMPAVHPRYLLVSWVRLMLLHAIQRDGGIQRPLPE
jgi:hypothetical protein